MPNYHPIFVWDRIQRVIHWVIAFAVLLLIPLGIFILSADYLHIPDESADMVMDIHVIIGFIFGAGVLARIIYLFIGPHNSSWRDTVPHTRAQWSLAGATVKYYLSGFKGKVPLYLSHNPFAGIAYTIFLIFALTQAGSGVSMFLLHGEGHGDHGAAHAKTALAHEQAPIDHVASANTETVEEEGIPDWLEDTHALGAFVIILFMLAHFGALGLHDIVERRGLLSSMAGGNKFFSDEEIDELRAEGKLPRE